MFNWIRNYELKTFNRTGHPEVLLGNGILKICSKFTGEHPCRSVISINLLCNFIKIAIWHGCSPVNLPHVFRKPFLKNTSGYVFLILRNLLISKELPTQPQLPKCPAFKIKKAIRQLTKRLIPMSGNLIKKMGSPNTAYTLMDWQPECETKVN